VQISLSWKLGLSYLAVAMLALVATDVLVGRVVRQEATAAATAQLEALAAVVAPRIPAETTPEALATWLGWAARSGARITLIDDSGRVLADSAHDPHTMENHSHRPEIDQARHSGRGLAVRRSATLRQEMVYFALRQDRPGRSPLYLRLALPLAAAEAEQMRWRWNLRSISVALLLLGLGLFLLISRRLARRLQRLAAFSRRVAEGQFTPTLEEAGHDELGRLAAALNETARRLDQTMRSLTEERDRTATLLRSMQEAVAALDRRAIVRFTNPAFARLVPEADVIEGRRLDEVLPLPEIWRLVDEALAGRAGHAEVSLPPPASAILEATAAPVSGRGAVLVLRDITELRRLERVRRDFVANVSHELKTPLTAIIGFAETLLSGALEDSEHSRRFLEILRDHARRMARLVDDLLDLSRMEAGRLLLRLEDVSLEELIEEAVRPFRLQVAEAGLRLSVTCPPLIVRCDPERLVQVVRNLLDNAFRYTPAGGTVTVRATADAAGEMATVTVADTGIGIPADQLDRIFERFYRLDAARARVQHGTGLGLSIARHLVQAMGGRIWVQSQEGKGSEFFFTVPLAGIPAAD
jgi:two-component system phosphate regulon sensor histidine kinase PhoR